MFGSTLLRTRHDKESRKLMYFFIRYHLRILEGIERREDLSTKLQTMFTYREMVAVRQKSPETSIPPLSRSTGCGETANRMKHDNSWSRFTLDACATSVKIARPVVRKMEQQSADYFSSDCPMAAEHLAALSKTSDKATHPMTLLRKAYGI